MDKKIKLETLLRGLGENVTVFIGANDGTGFTCICKSGELELIENVFNTYLEDVKVKRGKVDKKLHALLEEVLNIDLKTLSNEERDDYLRKLQNALKEKDYVKKYINSFTPVLERQVIDCYEKSAEKGVAIIVDGLEKGNFWFSYEFEETWRKRK